METQKPLTKRILSYRNFQQSFLLLDSVYYDILSYLESRSPFLFESLQKFNFWI